MAFMFEKPDVYQKAVDIAHEVGALIEGFPRGWGFLVDQLNRAALSIATDLAEGNGRSTKPDWRNLFTIALGSSQECVPLLEIARRRGLLQASAVVLTKERLEVIVKMISGLINGLDNRDQQKRTPYSTTPFPSPICSADRRAAEQATTICVRVSFSRGLMTSATDSAKGGEG